MNSLLPPTEEKLRWRGKIYQGAPLIPDYPGTTLALVVCVALQAIPVGLIEISSIGLITFALFAVAISIWFQVTQMRLQLVKVNAETFPRIDQLVKVACDRLGVSRPPVYVQSEKNPNAFALGFTGCGLVVLTSGILEFPDPEVLHVIGHEIGHLVRWHSPISSAIAYIAQSTAIPLLSPFVRLTSGSFRIRSEYSADRFGLVAADGDIASACRCLIRVSTGHGNIDPNAIEFDNSLFTNITELLGSHPFLGRRLNQLRKFSNEMY